MGLKSGTYILPLNIPESVPVVNEAQGDCQAATWPWVKETSEADAAEAITKLPEL
jgi:hypothetical protein